MRFDIVKHHRWWFTLSSILVILSLVSIFTKGFNLGIDYTGGTIVEVQFQDQVSVGQVRSDLEKFGLGNSVIQESTEGHQAGSDIIIRTRNLSASESNAVVDSLNKDVGKAAVKRVESVGAVIGSEVTEHALINLAVAFIALAIYISLRFPAP